VSFPSASTISVSMGHFFLLSTPARLTCCLPSLQYVRASAAISGLNASGRMRRTGSRSSQIFKMSAGRSGAAYPR
jgi:hypothetical protein